MTIARRDVLLGSAGALAFAGCGADLQLREGMSFDEVLARLHTTDSIINADYTNHGAMVAETLVTLGFDASVVPFLKVYGRDLVPLPAGKPIAASEHDASLGHGELRGAWISTFLAEVETTDAAALVQREWPSICGGYTADLFHGPIRLGHALRSLARENTAERRVELAHALGHWAAWDLPLPGSPGSMPTAGLDLVQALLAVPQVPVAERKKTGSMAELMSVLQGRADFAAAIGAVDLAVWPVERAVTELVAACARWFVAQPDIYVLHTVTGSSALRMLLPSLTVAQQREALGCAFHGVAGIFAVQGKSATIAASVEPSTSTWDAQLARAKTSVDAHVIKLVEACQREHAIDPRPEFLAAAAKWGGR